jgi:DNA-binding transcriptional LysR family regulator
MDRLDAMHAFVTVAELRGFAAAARKLAISPPVVTRLVAALEAQVGIRLLARTTRAVALTDAGARYLERARRILADVDDADRAARAENAEPTGRLVVAAPATFGRREVAPLVCELLARHPALRAELVLSDHMVSLVDEGIDVAVRIGTLPDSSARARAVGSTRRLVVGSPAYLAARKRLRTPADLAGHALVQFTSLTPAPEWTFARRGRLVRVPIEPRFVTNSADAAVGHAARGGGLAMVLAYQAHDALSAGTVVPVLTGYEPPPSPIHVVYPATRLPSASLRAFIELAATRRWKF